MKEVLLIGGGGHCKSVIDVIEQTDNYRIAGIIDRKELIGSDVLGYKIIGSDDDLENLRKQFSYAFVTVGFIKSNVVRKKLYKKLKELSFSIPTIISPLAYVAKDVCIDEGSVIHHQVFLNSSVKIGKNCIINSKALIEHDSVVEDNCHISTGAIVNGGAIVQKDSFVGSNACVINGAEVSGFIKAGSIAQ